MKRLNLGQRRVISGFFSTIAAAWFGAGIITTVFVRPNSPGEVVYNIAIGVSFTFLSLLVAVKLEALEK